MPKITLKHSKETHQLQIQEDDTFQLFQAKVYALTTVPPKNMKLLLKGKQLKDDASVQGLKQGSVLTLFGTPEEKMLKKIEVSKEAFKIVKQEEGKREYNGLENLGNTCYLNAGVQFLGSIPQLRKWISKAKLQPYGYEGSIKQLGDIWSRLEKGTVAPKQFVVMFLMMNQEFTPLGKQQDSEQFVQKIVEYLQKVGKYVDEEGGEKKLASHLFEIEFQEKLKNLEIPEEEEKISFSTALKLGCTIGGQIDLKIKNLNEGINAYLNGSVEKTSSVDGQLHTYSKHSQINSLPPYLIVQKVRFFWKEANELSGTKATNTKITKPVDFPLTLDVFQFCTSTLKQKLEKGRQYDARKQQQKKKLNDNRLNDFRQKMKQAQLQQRELFKQFKTITQAEDLKQHNDQIYRDHNLGLQTGEYNLVSVITHQGLSADSGHYLAWAHESGVFWNQFNDDTVSEHKQEDVLGLKGGLANSQMAYVLLYRKREVI